MKTIVIILSVVGLLSFSSCMQKTELPALMKNADTRSEVMNAIVNNHDYMTEFMANMNSSDHAMQMMQGEGIQMMMKDSMMMMNMMSNKQIMHSMMKGMMNDGKMMGTMMKMMHEKGMMSEDCMESCSKMMSEKGMDMEEMNMMGEMEKKTDEDHAEHH